MVSIFTSNVRGRGRGELLHGGSMDAPSKFRPINFGLLDCKGLPSAVPLVLQSNYEWIKAENKVKLKEDLQAEVGVTAPELHLIPEALEMLKTIQKPVAVLAICGPYRTGKSFFMSRVVGQKNTFALGHSMEACTRGIWLSTRALECDEFVLLLLDTEGVGAVEGEGPESITTKLLVTTILLSSYLIYNSMEVPKQADLQQMSSFAHLSTTVTISDKTTEHNPKEFQKHFPQFMWLLRDVVNPPCDDDGTDMLPLDYLHDKVLQPTGHGSSDNVIDAIRTLFPQPLMCVSLPPPNDGSCSLEKEENIDEDFVEQSNELINGDGGIKGKIRPKAGFAEGIEVTGSVLAELAITYVAAMNKKGSVPSLEGGWKAVIKLKLAEEAKKMVQLYETEMETNLNGKLPMEHSVVESESTQCTLMGLHRQVFHAKRKCLLEKIHQMLPQPSQGEPPVEESKSVVAGFEKEIAVEVAEGEGVVVKSGVLLQFVTRNFKASEKQCEELWGKLETVYETRDKSAKALNQNNATLCNEVCQGIQSLQEDYNANAIGPARRKVLLRKKRDLDELEESMHSIPGPPMNIAVVGRAKDKIKLQWDLPEINPEAAKKFIVNYRTKGKNWQEAAVTPGQWCIIDELKPNTKYEFQIGSWNDEAKRARDEIQTLAEKGHLLTGTRLGKLACAVLSATGFISGTVMAPIVSGPSMVSKAKKFLSEPGMASKGKGKLKAVASIAFLATLGAPIVGGMAVQHVMKKTGDWGDLEERYVAQEECLET